MSWRGHGLSWVRAGMGCQCMFSSVHGLDRALAGQGMGLPRRRLRSAWAGLDMAWHGLCWSWNWLGMCCTWTDHGLHMDWGWAALEVGWAGNCHEREMGIGKSWGRPGIVFAVQGQGLGLHGPGSVLDMVRAGHGLAWAWAGLVWP
jgi:hypothetical protein